MSYAQEEITKFDRFVAYSFNDIPDNYSIQCDFYQSNIDFNGVGIDIKCLIAWNVAIRPCELEKLARRIKWNGNPNDTDGRSEAGFKRI